MDSKTVLIFAFVAAVLLDLLFIWAWRKHRQKRQNQIISGEPPQKTKFLSSLKTRIPKPKLESASKSSIPDDPMNESKPEKKALDERANDNQIKNPTEVKITPSHFNVVKLLALI